MIDREPETKAPNSERRPAEIALRLKTGEQVRLPRWVIARVDAIAKRRSASEGRRVSRADVFRGILEDGIAREWPKRPPLRLVQGGLSLVAPPPSAGGVGLEPGDGDTP